MEATFWQAFSRDQVMVLGLNHSEGLEIVRNFGIQFGLTFPLLLDGAQYQQYSQPGISPFPLDYIIDRDGKVAYFNTEYDPVAMLAMVDSLINPQTGIDDDIYDNLPNQFKIIGNYPNPFNSSTTISFNSPVNGSAQLSVFDLLGRKVTDMSLNNVVVGENNVVWNISGRGESGLNSGIYFYTISIDGNKIGSKMVYLK